jgi:hypothetical protein
MINTTPPIQLMKEFNLIEVRDVDSTYNLDDMLTFCNGSINDKREGAKNISSVNWETNTASLLYLIYNERRFDSPKAKYKIVIADGEIICGGGYAPLNVDDSICLLSVRTYTLPKYRIRMWGSEFIIPKCIVEAREIGYKACILTFNEYNLPLKTLVERMNAGRLATLGVDVTARKVFKDFKSLEWPVIINNTKQWVMYFCFDAAAEASLLETMEKIRAKDNT